MTLGLWYHVDVSMQERAVTYNPNSIPLSLASFQNSNHKLRVHETYTDVTEISYYQLLFSVDLLLYVTSPTGTARLNAVYFYV
jgi:hypothetical protein